MKGWQAAACRGLFSMAVFVLLVYAISPHGTWRLLALGFAAGMTSWWIKP